MNEKPNQHLSLGLRSIASKLAQKGETVLDLGPLSTLTAPLFLGLKCRYFVEDMNDYIYDLNQDSSDPLNKLDKFWLSKPNDTKFDYILCWDLFNFLPLDVIGHLMSLLKPYMKSGTVLHTIRYIGTAAPNLPKRFKRIGDYNFAIEEDHESEQGHISPQSHTTIMLLRTMPEFSLFDTALNKKGMMTDVAEYLLEYDSIGGDRKIKRRLTSSDVASYFTQNEDAKRLQLKGISHLFESNDQTFYENILEVGNKNGRSSSETENRCKNLFVEDVYSSLTWQSKILGANSNNVSKQLLNFPTQQKFDLVLLWDILNFCTIEQIEKIGKLLSLHLLPGAKLHTLIHKSSLIPQTPGSFDVNKDLTTSLSGELTGDRQKHFRSITELMRYLPQYKLCFHHLGDKTNQHNYQDFILEFKG